MSFNGSGVFLRLYNWVNDAAANIKIRADRMDNEMNGFATGLSTYITKDGQTTITANLPMATYKHTNVGAGTVRTEYSRIDQVQDGNLNWADGGGTADAITATYSPAISALVDGQECYVRATAANTSTTSTFSPNALTARTIVKNGNQALAVGDISGDGHELHLRYRASDTKWELLNPKGVSLTSNNTFTGTTTLTGSVVINGTSSGPSSISLAEDTDNGTNRIIIQPPASLAADYTLTLPIDDGNSGELLSTNGSGVLSWVAGTSAASQSDQETATSTTTYVAPATQQFHPSAAKFWGIVTVSAGVPTLVASYNVTGITDVGTGQLGVTIATDFSSANYAVLAMAERASTGTTASDILVVAVRNGTRLAGSFTLDCTSPDSFNYRDPATWFFVGYGDQ